MPKPKRLSGRRKAEVLAHNKHPPLSSRLEKSKIVAGVLAQLRRQGLAERDAETLLRCLGRIPGDWEQDKEPWHQMVKRRSRLSKKLRDLAHEIESDPDMGQLSFGIHATSLNGRPEPGMVTFAELLRSEANGLESSDRIHVAKGDGTTVSASEYEKSIRPTRAVAERSYTLLAVFDLLESFARQHGEKTRRAPNREAEVLAGVLLGEIIPAGTLTQLRKANRRRYYKDG